MADPVVSAAPAAAPSNPAPSNNASDVSNSPVTTPDSAKPVKPEQSNTQPVAEAAKKAEIRRMKLKVDKQEIELPEDEVIKLAQLGTASQKRFQEAAQQRKQAEDFVKMLKEGDLEALLKNPAIGRDPRKWAEEYLAKQLQAETLTPEQKEKQRFDEEKRQFEDEKRTKLEQEKHDENLKLQQKYSQEFDQQFTEVLSTSGLPKTQFTIKRLANYMEQAIKDGMEDVTPSDIVPLVRQDYLQEISDLFGQTDGDALLQLLGDGVANKIRKADLARLRGPVSPKPVDAAAPPKEEAAVEAEKKPMNVHEWRAFQASKRNS